MHRDLGDHPTQLVTRCLPQAGAGANQSFHREPLALNESCLLRIRAPISRGR